MKSKRVIIAAGGTGGHIIPAISIAKELVKEGIQVLFVGNRSSMEQELTRKNNFEFSPINVQKFYRKFTFAHIKFPFKLLKSIIDSKKIIKKFKPNAFLGTGGFVCGPVGYAAHLHKIPIFLQEQNSYPGVTTRILSKYATKIFLGNHDSKKYLPSVKSIYTGNPINQNAILEKKQLDFAKLGLSETSKKIFLFGGSQGSVILNTAFFPIVDDLLTQGFEIIWQIGNFSYEQFYAKVKNTKGIYAFAFTNEIGKIYNSVDLAIARAGALSLAELEAKKIPSILIPLPTAAGNHQYFNAAEMKNKHIAEIIEQNSLNSELLFSTILNMFEKLISLKRNFKMTVHSNAAQNIAATILNYIGKEK
ncbi:MAG: undecaprenyldiphospho-muramoylpentapeptide beta-N-acetylglucosaminyltransferase [Candidatus Cloacimonetes bacterium]|nr:undecaprenyldiphospho-muramoylpentapeptide beta-N-acetylglucosaminyltransferase [Candidatus Cloacimonadota bacterium]